MGCFMAEPLIAFEGSYHGINGSKVMTQPTAQCPDLGPYQLDSLLGKGGMGEVYKAFDGRLERWVAVKRLSQGATLQTRERFRREARTLAQLGHPGIVQIFDIVESPDVDWIVMELIAGPTLADLRRDGPLDVGLALKYAGQIASALESAHRSGIVHRDLKAENVMISPSGHAKVLDFGLASRAADGRAAGRTGGDRLPAPHPFLEPAVAPEWPSVPSWQPILADLPTTEGITLP